MTQQSINVPLRQHILNEIIANGGSIESNHLQTLVYGGKSYGSAADYAAIFNELMSDGTLAQSFKDSGGVILIMFSLD